MRVRVLFDQYLYLPIEDKSMFVCGNASEESYLSPTLPRYETTSGDIHRQLEINDVNSEELQFLQQLKDADLIVELFVHETDSEKPVNSQGLTLNQYIESGDYVRDNNI